MRAESRGLGKAAHLEAARKQRARQGTFSERPPTLLPFSKQAPAQTSPSAYQTLSTLKTQFLSLPQPTGSQHTLCLQGALSIQITPGGQRIKWTYSKPGADSKNGIQIKRKIREGVTYAASTWIAILSRLCFLLLLLPLCSIVRSSGSSLYCFGLVLVGVFQRLCVQRKAAMVPLTQGLLAFRTEQLLLSPALLATDAITGLPSLWPEERTSPLVVFFPCAYSSSPLEDWLRKRAAKRHGFTAAKFFNHFSICFSDL